MNLHRNLQGETPLDDYSGLKLKQVKTREQLNAAEFSNNLQAVTKYLSRKPTKRMAPFTGRWMLRLHKEMFSTVWVWAGKIRTTGGLNIGIPAHQVEIALEKLARDIACWREGEWDLIEQSATLHHRSVQIHPFLNGNGRWSRLLANIWIKQNGGSVVTWPTELRQESSVIRDRYIESIKQADEGNIDLLVSLHRQYSERADS